MSPEGTSPQFPQGLPNDAEDVSWALSTGQAMWNRGDAVEAIRWLKRASDAASEAGADDRAFALARAAAELKIASGAGTMTPQPPDVRPAQPVIPAPPPPLASPNRPAAFAPPSRAPAPHGAPSPPPHRPPTTPPPGGSYGAPAGYGSASHEAAEYGAPHAQRGARPGATTLQSPALATPSPRPGPSVTPPPGAVVSGSGPTPSSRPRPPAGGSVAPPTSARGSGSGGPVSQRSGTVQMSATPPAPPTPFPSAFPAPVRPFGPSPSPSTAGMAAVTTNGAALAHTSIHADPSPLSEDDEEEAGEATILNQPSPLANAVTDPPLRLIDDVPTMARVQPFELTGALDSRPPAAGSSRAPQPRASASAAPAPSVEPPSQMITPSAPDVVAREVEKSTPPPVGLDLPPARGPLATPASAAVPAMRGWLHRVDGVARVSPFTSPKPEGAVEIIVLSADESVNLLEYLSS
jgi:hypothetical protein